MNKIIYILLIILNLLFPIFFWGHDFLSELQFLNILIMYYFYVQPVILLASVFIGIKYFKYDHLAKILLVTFIIVIIIYAILILFYSGLKPV